MISIMSSETVNIINYRIDWLKMNTYFNALHITVYIVSYLLPDTSMKQFNVCHTH